MTRFETVLVILAALLVLALPVGYYGAMLYYSLSDPEPMCEHSCGFYVSHGSPGRFAR